MKRRDFLMTAGALACAPAMASGCAPARGAQKLDRIGIQLYTVRDLMAKSVPATLDALAAIGYREMEFAGYFEHAPGEIAGFLGNAGLTAPSAHIPLEMFEGDLDTLIDLAGAVGHEYLILPWLKPEDRTIDRFKEIADLLNRAGEKAGAAGIRVGYHNHDFEFAAIDGVEPYEVLLAETDPDLVALELDLFWLAVAGRDPLTYIDRYPGRVPAVHVKDRDAAGNMVDVGAGILDFTPVFAAAEKAGLKHYFIEHDRPVDSLATAQAGFAALEALSF